MTTERTASAPSALNDDIPTLYEELNRKTLDVALDLITKLEKSEISPAQFYTGYKVLFDTISGLASNESVMYAFEGANMVKKNEDQSFTRSRTFLHSSRGVAMLNQYYGDDMLNIRIYNTDGANAKDSRVYADKEDMFAARLVNLGYKELT